MKTGTEILKRAIKTWGDRAQLEMALEESIELSLAIRKYLRDPTESRFNDLASEVADVEIMIEQIKIIVSGISEKIEEQKDYKLIRLNERLDIMRF